MSLLGWSQVVNPDKIERVPSIAFSVATHAFHIKPLWFIIWDIRCLTVLIHLHFPLLIRVHVKCDGSLAGIGHRLPEVAARV